MMEYFARFLKLRSLRDRAVKFKCECGYTFNAKLRNWWRFTSHFELKTTTFFWKNVNKADLVFDIGTHIGMHTIHLAKIAKFIYAIEPEPNNLRLLPKNISINNVEKKVIVLAYVASSINGFVDFYVSPESTGAHHILPSNENSTYFKDKAILKVQAYTLDTSLFNILRVKPCIIHVHNPQLFPKSC